MKKNTRQTWSVVCGGVWRTHMTAWSLVMAMKRDKRICRWKIFLLLYATLIATKY